MHAVWYDAGLVVISPQVDSANFERRWPGSELQNLTLEAEKLVMYWGQSATRAKTEFALLGEFQISGD